MKVDVQAEMDAQNLARQLVAQRIDFSYEQMGCHVFTMPEIVGTDDTEWVELLEEFEADNGEVLEVTVVT